MSPLITKTIIALATLLVTIIAIQYSYWRQAAGLPTVTITATLDQILLGLIRLARKGYFGVLWCSTKVWGWVSRKVQAFFLVLFPKAQSAFTEKNVLTGLSDGPLSYYLKSISDNEK